MADDSNDWPISAYSAVTVLAIGVVVLGVQLFDARTTAVVWETTADQYRDAATSCADRAGRLEARIAMDSLYYSGRRSSDTTRWAGPPRVIEGDRRGER